MLLEHAHDNTQTTEINAPADPDWTPLDASTLHMLSLLQCLHTEHNVGRSQVPLAVLCKRLALRMSTVQRLMTALESQWLVEVQIEKARLVASLTAQGVTIAQALQSV